MNIENMVNIDIRIPPIMRIRILGGIKALFIIYYDRPFISSNILNCEFFYT